MNEWKKASEKKRKIYDAGKVNYLQNSNFENRLYMGQSIYQKSWPSLYRHLDILSYWREI